MIYEFNDVMDAVENITGERAEVSQIFEKVWSVLTARFEVILYEVKKNNFEILALNTPQSAKEYKTLISVLNSMKGGE